MHDLSTQAEEDFPIDIHSNKLLDWLIDRHHCKIEWQSSIIPIRKLIHNAIQDMPAVEEITQLLSGTYIHYYHCLRIVELLKETESGTKNIFGRYSSQRMKDWQEIIRLYEKNNIYLAEAAQLLIQNVNYEIPSLKKQILKCQQIEKDSERKEAEYISNSNMHRENFYTACKQIGIEGKKIKSELVALLDNIPQVLENVSTSAKNIQDAYQFYKDFVAFTLQSVEKSDNCLPMLRFLQEKGNCTVFEWRTGRTPVIIQEPKIVIDLDEEKDNTSSDQIDFGESIDFGDISLDSSPVIDFPEEIGGITVEDGKMFPDVASSIELIDDDKIDFELVPTASDIEGNGEQNIAHGLDALTVLDNVHTRNVFINDLMELEAFLEQRINEMNQEGDSVTANQFQSANIIIQLQNVETLSPMLCLVKSILSDIMSDKMQNLFLFKNSTKHIDRVAQKLKQHLDVADKLMEISKACINKRNSAIEEQLHLEPKLNLIIQKTKELQKNIEEDISKRYKNRRVNIMGAITAI